MRAAGKPLSTTATVHVGLCDAEHGRTSTPGETMHSPRAEQGWSA